MSKTTRRKSIKLKIDLNEDNVTKECENCDIPEKRESVSPLNESLKVINELNDLIIAKRDLIVDSFSSKRGSIGRDQIKDYLNQMVEVVTLKRNEILGENTSTTTTNVSKFVNSNNDNSIDSQISQKKSQKKSKVSEVSQNENLENSSKVTKTKNKSKSKNIQKSIKRRKSVGRKGIGKLLFDYRNRNRIPDYQKRLKYVERDPTIDILHKKIGLVSTRLSSIPESNDEF